MLIVWILNGDANNPSIKKPGMSPVGQPGLSAEAAC